MLEAGTHCGGRPGTQLFGMGTPSMARRTWVGGWVPAGTRTHPRRPWAHWSVTLATFDLLPSPSPLPSPQSASRNQRRQLGGGQEGLSHVHRRPGERRPCAGGWCPRPMLRGALWEDQPRPWRAPQNTPSHREATSCPHQILVRLRTQGSPLKHLPSATSERGLQGA